MVLFLFLFLFLVFWFLFLVVVGCEVLLEVLVLLVVFGWDDFWIVCINLIMFGRKCVYFCDFIYIIDYCDIIIVLRCLMMFWRFYILVLIFI